jgi:hypothetical protein
MISTVVRYGCFFLAVFATRYYSFFFIVLPAREFVSNNSQPTFSSFLLLNFCLSIFYYLIKFLSVISILYAGLFFYKTSYEKVSFVQLFNLTVNCEFVFLLSDAVKIFYFEFYLTDITEPQFVNFYPLSIFNMFNGDWGLLSYLLQVLNGFEFLYIILLSRGISALTQSSFGNGLKVVSFSYGALLILWVLIITYLNL